MANGLFEGALGGNLLKKRIARSGKVSVVACGRWWRRTRAASVFFVCGLVKNERSNIDNDKEVALKKLTATLLTMTLSALAKVLEADELIEVNCDA